MHHVIPARYPVGTISIADPEIRRGDADPGIFAKIEIDHFRLDDGLGDQSRVERDHHGAVLRLRRVERANGHETSCAGLVLNDDGRMARYVVGDEAGEDAGIDVVAPTGSEADDDGERLAF